ncbi:MULTISPECIES: hemerythrin domain-containing protein [unclassified Halomonas]|uniref:hemerythrin domain-containing protein n=1 Tax=unclassified Halomonas TaxID=2609666 RepID=UPI001CF292F8|nr:MULTISPECIES: hemerythrin domain-containing protein [unclassified Halomonas]MCA8863274.1 hemerythrin domain-containing protein [Halomonas sp. SBBP1]UZH08593.1 hemerythrin domain-containing protein [Halomonas sp. BDJS001]
MTIFEALRQDHDIQRDLLARLVETHGDSDERDNLYQQVRAELRYHAAAEERALYIPMMSIDLTQEKARHSVAEHHEIDELLELLDETDYSATHWLTHAKQLQDLVTHHLDEEEQEVFQLAGRGLQDKQKTSLAGEYQEEMQRQRSA